MASLVLRVSASVIFCVGVVLPAHGAQAEGPLTLRAGLLDAEVDIERGHLAPLRLHDQGSRQTPILGPEFLLKLTGGRVLRSTEMKLAHAPETLAIPAEPAASRAAARLPGQQICADLEDAESGVGVHWCLISRGPTPYLRQEVTVEAGRTPLPLEEIDLVELREAGAHVVGTVAGSPVVSGNFFFGLENPLSFSAVQAGEAVSGLKRTLPLPQGQRITYSSVMGVARPGQMRRDFQTYVEMERAHPYRTFLHYNTWYDLGEGNRYGAAQVLDRMHAFGEELVRKRGVTMDSFLMDDGWDNTSSLWQFDRGFPDGFAPLQATAQKYGFGIGVWLSPWGGYEREKQERIAFGKSQNYEVVKDGYALSGPRYYAKFEEACRNFITKYGVNQFKIDGTGNADQVFPGSIFDSDFSAAIHLIESLRRIEPNVFMNVTTGTKPSPFWLRYADSIFRSGEDHDFAGEGSWRQRWITYRDEQTYRNIVQGGPLFPLSSVMLHGLVYAAKAEHLGDDPEHDFPAEVRSFFGSGTQVQEMYLTPSLLSASDWDVLAESARWSRANAATLVDTHWIGGDPGRGEVYGWASWSAAKGILVLRNPTSKPQSLSLDLQKAFELPPAAPRRYRARSPWAADKALAELPLEAGKAHAFALRPFEVLVLEATPLP